jgi:hypothetical protein
MSELDFRAADLAHVWHPFTPMQAWRGDDAPLIERGHDAQGIQSIQSLNSSSVPASATNSR